jgi:acetyltransferase-like isoleucine patch superfamily enzyme
MSHFSGVLKIVALKQRLISFARKSLPDKLNALHVAFYRLKGILYYRHVFASFGEGSVLFKPMLLTNPQFMHIGKNVLIRAGVRLEAVMIDADNPPQLHIGDNVNIEQDAHIVFLGKVYIADNVSIAARCSLLGGTHPFLEVDDPTRICKRLSGVNSVIEVGEGSFLGLGTVVCMNVRIGKQVVVGTNSVVKRNIAAYSVADGNPAVVILRYDFEKESWIRLQRK